MNIKKILADAPEGAQRYNRHLLYPYLRKTKASIEYWEHHSWVKYTGEIVIFRDGDWNDAVTLASLRRGYIATGNEIDKMKYTIGDLRGKYVKVGTPECEIFTNTCDMLGIRWASGESARNKHQDKECIALGHPTEFLSYSDLSYYQSMNHWDLFEPKTVTAQHIDWRKASERAQPFIDDVINHTHGVTQRTAESSAVKNLESSPDTMTIGEMVDSGQSVFGGCITQCDDVDNTVTQRGERYGLFADGAKYERTLVGLCGTHVKTDVYRVLDAFNTGDPILDHLIKKALCAGLRGHKDKLTDYRNIVESAEKALKLLEQKQNGN